VNYQSLLLSQVFKSGSLKLSNSFSNPSLIRKRMIMMTKKPTSGLANLKLLSVIPVTAMVFLLVSAKPDSPITPSSDDLTITRTEAAELPYATVDIMPVFPGGDSQLLKYISENTAYPDAAKQKNEQGRVIVRFCVTSKGTISQVSVQKSVSPELDKEAIRVVNSLPAFIPGRQDGKPVPVWYMVPITFTLR
jgi:TonB family protein